MSIKIERISDALIEQISYIVSNKVKNKDINLIVATATFIKLLLLNKEFNEENFVSLKYVYQCGECLEVSVAQKFLDEIPVRKKDLFNYFNS
mgnify:CR=1 FL=1